MRDIYSQKTFIDCPMDKITVAESHGIIAHHIAIGIESASEKVGLEKVFDFDEKTYDIGIRDKVFIAVPGLTNDAKQFAQRQRIKVIEAKEL